MPTSRTLIPLALLASFALFAAACGDDSDDDATADGGNDGAPAVDAEAGGREDQLFIQIEYVGGFVPAGFDFRSIPTAVVYDDGTVLAPGVTTAIYPGPAVLPVFTGEIDADAIADLVAAASEAGILDGLPDLGDMGDLNIADAATTRVTVVVDGEEHVVEAYALSEGGLAGPAPGLDDEQLEARAALSEFVAAVDEATMLAATEPYDPQRYRVLGMPPVDPSTVDVDVPQQPWPEGVPEPVEGECVSITGEGAVAAFEEALATANELTQWTVGDRTFSVVVRPVLPHEPDC